MFKKIKFLVLVVFIMVCSVGLHSNGTFAMQLSGESVINSNIKMEELLEEVKSELSLKMKDFIEISEKDAKEMQALLEEVGLKLKMKVEDVIEISKEDVKKALKEIYIIKKEISELEKFRRGITPREWERYMETNMFAAEKKEYFRLIKNVEMLHSKESDQKKAAALLKLMNEYKEKLLLRLKEIEQFPRNEKKIRMKKSALEVRKESLKKLLIDKHNHFVEK